MNFIEFYLIFGNNNLQMSIFRYDVTIQLLSKHLSSSLLYLKFLFLLKVHTLHRNRPIFFSIDLINRNSNLKLPYNRITFNILINKHLKPNFFSFLARNLTKVNIINFSFNFDICIFNWNPSISRLLLFSWAWVQIKLVSNWSLVDLIGVIVDC